MKSTDNPIHPTQQLTDAPRCKAMAKSTRSRCKCPAVRGWSVCRMHGAGGAAPYGPCNVAWWHGERSRGAQQVNRAISSLAKLSHQGVQEVLHLTERDFI